MLQYIGQRLPGMAGRIVSGAFLHSSYFSAQIRNAVCCARIGRRGEQADDTMFADEIPRRVETLYPDVVEIDAPMNPCVHIGLGYDQQPRLLQKGDDFRRGFEELVATPEHAEFT